MASPKEAEEIASDNNLLDVGSLFREIENNTEPPTLILDQLVQRNENNNLYKELMELEAWQHVPNVEAFECSICLEECQVGEGAILRDCAHMFCKECVASTIIMSTEVIVSCPATSCTGIVEEREMRAVLSEDQYNIWLLRSLAAAEVENITEPTEVMDQLVQSNGNNNLYKELMDLEAWQHVPNVEAFQCSICLEECQVGEGIILRDCAHMFCKECVASTIINSTEVISSCPASSCTGIVEEREMRALLSEDQYNIWLLRSLSAVENTSKQSFHCCTINCPGWAFCEEVQSFLCPVCQCVSCVECKAIHEGLTCSDFKFVVDNSDNIEELQSYSYMQTMVASREAMRCPGCDIVILRTGGCDAVQCIACKTHICWATRGPRWGPAGVGDTSGGCNCGENGIKCTPRCSNCH